MTIDEVLDLKRGDVLVNIRTGTSRTVTRRPATGEDVVLARANGTFHVLPVGAVAKNYRLAVRASDYTGAKGTGLTVDEVLKLAPGTVLLNKRSGAPRTLRHVTLGGVVCLVKPDGVAFSRTAHEVAQNYVMGPQGKALKEHLKDMSTRKPQPTDAECIAILQARLDGKAIEHRGRTPGCVMWHPTPEGLELNFQHFEYRINVQNTEVPWDSIHPDYNFAWTGTARRVSLSKVRPQVSVVGQLFVPRSVWEVTTQREGVVLGVKAADLTALSVKDTLIVRPGYKED